MPHCVFDKATGIFIGGSRYKPISFDAVNHIEIELPEFPDRILERWDGANGVRPATPQEIEDHRQRSVDKIIANFNGPLSSVITATFELVSNPAQFLTLEEFRQRILQIYRDQLL